MLGLIKNIKLGSLDGVKAIVEQNPHCLSETDPINGFTPLHCAAMIGNRAVAAFLIEKGAPLHVADAKGRWPVQLAYTTANQPLIELFEWHTFDLLRESKEDYFRSNVIHFPFPGPRL